MATVTQQRKLKKLFETSMTDGGPKLFRNRWEQSIGLQDVETNSGRAQVFDPTNREQDYANWQVGEVMYSMCGPNWQNNFEQFWQRASNQRFEGVGGDVTGGMTPYVSAGLDVIAGLMNARALARAKDPEWIWDRVCRVEEAVGEGGFHIGSRVMPTNNTFYDLGPNQQLPTQDVAQTRVHRNRTLNQGLRTKVNHWAIRDDLTSQIMESVDQNSVFVLQERERKVADAVMGVATGTTLATGANIGTPGQALPMVQDGLTFFPWQTGTLGTNAGATTLAPENNIAVANYANDGTATGAGSGDTFGLQDYTAIVRAMQMLLKNNDPFTGLPPNIQFQRMQFLIAPAAAVQLRFLLQAQAIWQIAQYGLGSTNSPAGVAATTSGHNIVEELKLEILESQFWFNRATSAGLYKVGSTGTAYHQTLTNTQGDSYATTGSVMSMFLMGHFREAVIYWQRMPYQVIQVPLSSIEYGEQTVLVQDHRERGQAFWHNPRQVYRTWK